jgi:hypothetical protein
MPDKRPASSPDKRPASSPAAAQLQQLAEQEAGALRERHKARDGAIRQYDIASAAIADAEKLVARAKQDQSNAIATLLESGLDVTNVASVLGLDPRRVREARPASRTVPPARPSRTEHAPAAVPVLAQTSAAEHAPATEPASAS